MTLRSGYQGETTPSLCPQNNESYSCIHRVSERERVSERPIHSMGGTVHQITIQITIQIESIAPSTMPTVTETVTESATETDISSKVCPFTARRRQQTKQTFKNQVIERIHNIYSRERESVCDHINIPLREIFEGALRFSLSPC